MGMVFQYYAIWPHMTVYQNVAFGLEVLKRSKNETKERAARILDIVDLKGLERRYPGQLSGGKLQQYGPPRDIYQRPANRMVADFMGLVNLIPTKVLDREGSRWQLSLGGAAVVAMAIPFKPRLGAEMMLAVRPENVHLGEGTIKGIVRQATLLGNLNDPG